MIDRDAIYPVFAHSLIIYLSYQQQILALESASTNNISISFLSLRAGDDRAATTLVAFNPSFSRLSRSFR